MDTIRRAVQFEITAAQFDRFGERSIKGFRKFNPEWDIVVCDLGLTDTQRELVESAGIEICSGAVPFQVLRDLLDTYDTVLRLNVATFTFAPVTPWVTEFEEADFDISACVIETPLRESARNVDHVIRVLGVDAAALDRVALDVGVMLLRKSDKVISILDTILHNYAQLVGTARLREIVWMSVLVWHHGCNVLIPKPGYIAYPAFTARHRSYIAASDHPVTSEGDEIIVLYFRYEKHYFTRIDGWQGLGYRVWAAWCEATKHFLELPWTT